MSKHARMILDRTGGMAGYTPRIDGQLLSPEDIAKALGVRAAAMAADMNAPGAVLLAWRDAGGKYGSVWGWQSMKSDDDLMAEAHAAIAALTPKEPS